MAKDRPEKAKATPAQNNLRAEGAEFLVLGHLLMRDIQSTKAYTRFPGWDILAVDADSGKQARIQVKSRWASDSGNFLVKNFDCDFVVLVHLNRGFNFKKRNHEADGIKEPQFWIIPVSYLKDLIKKKKKSVQFGGSYSFRRSEMDSKGEAFEANWDLISDFMKS
jgi:hypothetical protein